MFLTKKTVFYVFIIIFTAISVQTATKLPEIQFLSPPFWENKPKLMKRINDEREIIVSVKSVKVDSIKLNNLLTMQGIGVVNSTAESSFKLSKNFKNFEKISSYILKSTYYPKKNKLFMHTVAFKYHAKMWMEVNSMEQQPMPQIRFKVTKGVFSGMNGVLRFKNIQNEKCEIHFLATYKYSKLPIPQFFIEFGLEIVIQKIAAKLRNFIEVNS